MSSGDTLLIFHPYNNEPPSSNYATLDLRNNHPVLDFDPDTDESAIFSSVMPRSYAGTTGVTVYIHWSADGATANNVIWDVAFERIGDGQQDVDSDGFAAVQSVTDAAPGTDGFVTIANVALTNGAQMDNVAVGEKFRMKVTRDADNGSDSLLVDAELHAVEIKET
jgi:hypothetical protein